MDEAGWWTEYVHGRISGKEIHTPFEISYTKKDVPFFIRSKIQFNASAE